MNIKFKYAYSILGHGDAFIIDNYYLFKMDDLNLYKVIYKTEKSYNYFMELYIEGDQYLFKEKDNEVVEINGNALKFIDIKGLTTTVQILTIRNLKQEFLKYKVS